MTPAVSVVVPTYNRAGSLARLLHALAVQDLDRSEFEVIVVDDGSTHGTAEVLAAAPLDVVAIRQDNAGPAAARNRGWRAARAPLVAFTDDDCVPDPDWLHKLTAPFADASVAGAGGRIVPITDGFVAGFVQCERLVDHGPDGDGGYRYLVTANAAYRRAALEAVGGFDESFPAAAGEDVDLSARVRAAAGSLAAAPEAVVRHEHPDRFTTVLRNYRKHGRARALLAQRHRDYGAASGTASALSPSRWRAQYRSYRGEAGRGRAAAYLVMRAAGLAAFGYGFLRGRRAR